MVVAVDGMTADARNVIGELLELRGQPIVLIPAVGVVTEKPGGGKDYASAAPRDPQVFAMFNTSGADGREQAESDQGLTRQFRCNMIGAYDAVVQVGDAWEDDVASYTVESVDNTTAYQVKAVVAAVLKSTGHGSA